jgi:hypothetical protein
MGASNYNKWYPALTSGALPTPNTVSGNAQVEERAFATVVWQSGKMIVDVELQLGQDLLKWEIDQLRQWEGPSGWMLGRNRYDLLQDYYCGNLYGQVTDNSDIGSIAVTAASESGTTVTLTLSSSPSWQAGQTIVVSGMSPSGYNGTWTLTQVSGSSVQYTAPGGIGVGTGFGAAGIAVINGAGVAINGFAMPRRVAMVAGRPVVVEYTNTTTPGANLIALSPPTIYDGTSPTVKRTDFVFLEVWYALVAPSPYATGTVNIAVNSSIVAGDLVAIATIDLQAVSGAPGANQFQIGATAANTATNLMTTINAAPALSGVVTADVNGTVVTVSSATPGSIGNSITLALVLTHAGSITLSGATLTGGADRPSKPAQDQLWRHGNVLSPSATWLADQLHPVAGKETAQRVQLQYRIRATTAAEAVNFKLNPDGFSASGGTHIYAQAGTTGPVSNYPFVRADGASTWMNTSAAAYGIVDPGLWIAGSGSQSDAENLGSVDGFVYAIPICFVHRHNNASDASDTSASGKGFDPESNANGAPTYTHASYTGNLGTIAANKSDRPDGEFCDVQTPTQFLDLRHHVLLSGLDSGPELDYQIQTLLDGNNRTWSVDIADKQQMGNASGDVSTRYLVCDVLGRSTTDGNGTTHMGPFARSFDHFARRFGDQSIIERVLIPFYPGDRVSGSPGSGGQTNPGKYVTKVGGSPADRWHTGDQLHFDLTNFDCTSLGNVFDGGAQSSSGAGLTHINASHYMPPQTVITDILNVIHDDGHYFYGISKIVAVANITGLGTQHVEIDLDTNNTIANGGTAAGLFYPLVDGTGSGTGSPRRIFVEFEITYPIGQGTSCAPDLPLDGLNNDPAPDASVYNGASSGPGNRRPGLGPVVESDVTTRPTDMELPITPRFRPFAREIQLEYVSNGTTTVGSPLAGTPDTDQVVSFDQRTMLTPRRVFGSSGKPVTVTDIGSGSVSMTVNTATTQYGTSDGILSVTSNLSGNGQTLCQVTYFPQDPLPNFGPLSAGYTVGVYYRSNSPQTTGVMAGALGTAAGGALPTVFNLEPLRMSSVVWTGGVGAGSVDAAYPYGRPLDQIPINDGGSNLTNEWMMCANANISISDFDANTGLLSLHPFLPADTQNVFQFGSNSHPPVADADFRAYYPFALNTVYRPTILAQPLYGAATHKVMVPFLARVANEVATSSGGLLFRQNEVVLVVLSRYATLDNDNSVRFLDSGNQTSAAVYRTRNLLLVAGGTDFTAP